MPRIAISNFSGKLNAQDLARINTRLNNELNAGLDNNPNGRGAWRQLASSLMNFLNEYEFANNEGFVVNDETIGTFINRVKQEETEDLVDDVINMTGNNLKDTINIGNSIPHNTGVNMNPLKNYTPVVFSDNTDDLIEDVANMTSNNIGNSIIQNSNFSQSQMQQPQQINPLEDLLINTISVQDLLNIYNKYCPNPISIQQVQQNSQGNQDLAKAYLLNEVLKAARDGYLVKGIGGGFGHSKIGMNDLMHIILDLQRDVKRVSNAISPQGAQKMVDKHNAENPSSPWTLHTNDINGDNIPDIIIRNKRGEPMYVNGYTTKKSNYPLVYNYYKEHPTRESRKKYPLSQYKNDIMNVQYVNEGNAELWGNLKEKWKRPKQFVNDEGLDYNMSGYSLRVPKRLSSYQRFVKYALGEVKNDAFQFILQNGMIIPDQIKLRAFSKAAGYLWRTKILEPLYRKYQANTEGDAKIIKKKAAGEIDNTVSKIIHDLHNDGGASRKNLLNELIASITNETISNYSGQYQMVEPQLSE